MHNETIPQRCGSTSIRKPLIPIQNPKRIAVLLGGWSVERDISLSTGQAVIKALKSIGHEVVAIDPSSNLQEFIFQLETCFPNKLSEEKNGRKGYPDLVFNALHGKWGEDGKCQAILETLGLKFTHSSFLASAMAMNKPTTREIAKSTGVVRVPIGSVQSIDTYSLHAFQTYPHVLKPVDSGSSYGIKLVRNPQDVKEAVQSWNASKYGQQVLIEEYIPGKELTVAVFNGHAVGSCEIRFTQDIFDVTCKYVKGESYPIIPAPVHPIVHEEAMKWAAIMHTKLQCSGLSRCDFRYNDADGEPGTLYLLEINTQPGFTATSLTPAIMKALHGWSYDDVIQWIVDDATLKF